MDIEVETTPTSSSKAVIFGVGALCGAMLGSVVGYVIAKRKYTQPITIESISVWDPTARKFISEDEPLHSADESEPEEDILVVADGNIVLDRREDSAIVYNKPVEPPELDETPAPTVHDIFANNGEDWDYDTEQRLRRSNMPYVIHVDEYTENEDEFKQATYTYYEGDDVMVDAADTPVYNHAGLMGTLKFGHGSGDPSVVYIRNEQEKHDWEVIRMSSSYAVEVLGHQYEEDTEIRHSARHFRDE